MPISIVTKKAKNVRGRPCVIPSTDSIIHMPISIIKQKQWHALYRVPVAC